MRYGLEVYYLGIQPGQLGLIALPLSAGDGHHPYHDHCWGRNGEFCVTVGPGSGLHAGTLT